MAVVQIELAVERFEQVGHFGQIEQFEQIGQFEFDTLGYCFEQFVVHDIQVGLIKQWFEQVVKACIDRQ